MNKHLATLLASYKSCLEQIFEMNNKVDQVNTSEQLIANNEKTPEKVTELLEKVKLNVDTAVNRRCAEANAVKADIQYLIDDILWKFKDKIADKITNEDHYKQQLLDIIATLFEAEKQSYSTTDDENSLNQLHEDIHQWLLQAVPVFLTIFAEHEDRKRILQFLIDTPHVTWAIPLLQPYPITYNISEMNEYIDSIYLVLNKTLWTEEDNFLAALDQLAVDYIYSKFLDMCRLSKEKIQAIDTSLLEITQRMTNILFDATHQFQNMNTLVKRLCQTIVQTVQLLVEDTTICEQDQIDKFILELINMFRSADNSTITLFLPQFPFRALSTQALWQLALQVLCLSDLSEPTTVEEVLELAPNIDLFKTFLKDNPVQDVFMLSCLTNMVTSIPSGVDKLSQHDLLGTCTIIIISFALFNTAFVDKQLRSMYYKDVRDHFSLICQHHPFIISLLLRWTVEHMPEMQNMALYLFHSLPLDKWIILASDLKWLHQLLSSKNVVDIQFAKYILENLNYGYSDTIDTILSKSQPWHSRRQPFLDYSVHEDIAFLILDACQRHQPLPEPSKGAIDMVTSAVVSNYMAANSSNEFIQWSWTIIQRLKLYDCPVSTRATDIEQSLTASFLRLILNSYNDTSASHSALVVYTSFMLSATSRHFLRFEAGDGWLKLLTILKRGRPEAVISILSEMIPSFVYMHGDDMFNDASLTDFLKHVFLTKTQIDPVIEANMWQAQLIDDSVMEKGSGFSYVDLMMHCWLKTVFQRTDWINQKPLVDMMDTLCKLAFILKRRQLMHPMLVEEYKQLERRDSLQQQLLDGNHENNGSPKLTRFIKNMVYEGTAVPTLLVNNDEWFILKGLSKTPGVDNHHIWFAFEALMTETAIERSYRENIMKEEQKSIKRPMDFFCIYRWLHHILITPAEHPLLPLFLQMFFCLYYQKVDDSTVLGSILFSKKQELLAKLRNYIANIQTFYGQKIPSAPGTAEKFQQTYYAMWIWLGHSELRQPGYDISQLPSHFDVPRLTQCRLRTEDEQPWYDEKLFWMDLVDRDRLLQDFLQHNWEASDKFRTESKNVDYCSSSSLRSKRSRLIINETTIIPLPPVQFKEPNKV